MFLLARYSQKENKKILVITSAIMLGLIILQLPIRIYDFSGSVISMMVLINTLLSIMFTALCYYKRKVYLYAISVVIIVLQNTLVHEAWLNSFNPCK